MYLPRSIDELKATISDGGGVAKPNLFCVVLPAPSTTARTLSYLCTSVTLPSRQMNALERQVGLDRRQLVYGFSNPDVSMNFRVMNDQLVRRYFEAWQQRIVTPSEDGFEGNYDVAFPREYLEPVHIYQLQKGVSFPIFNKNKDFSLGPLNVSLDFDFDAAITEKSTYHWILEDAFPVTFQHETLQDGGDTISELTVEFSYRRWKGEKMDSKGKLGITGGAQISTNAGELIGKKIYDILG